ncbi:MAG: methyltransferase domain-containing protein, partial [Kiloniellales bacterium]|nr:methyltransferase domain-containing protein [Kiloniellales bacterium]
VDDEGLKTADESNHYRNDGGFYRLYVPEEFEKDQVTEEVQEFYTDAPFPNYNDFDDVATFVQRAERSGFAKMLRKEIPMNANVLEIGCGTGQMSNFLAATTMSHVYATDLTPASLRLGVDFAKKNEIKGITFLQMNLFRPCIKPQSMDIVISNGVLHHTYDTKKAFMSIAPLVKPGGHIIIGLYNKIGRLRTDFRRVLFKTFGEKALVLDPHLRGVLSAEKRRSWINDQYLHPQERKHSMSELLGWFEEAGFSFVSSIPNIADTMQASDKLFTPRSPGSSWDRTLAEIGMLFSTLGGEGGLYIMIGKKR